MTSLLGLPLMPVREPLGKAAATPYGEIASSTDRRGWMWHVLILSRLALGLEQVAEILEEWDGIAPAILIPCPADRRTTLVVVHNLIRAHHQRMLNGRCVHYAREQ